GYSRPPLCWRSPASLGSSSSGSRTELAGGHNQAQPTRKFNAQAACRLDQGGRRLPAEFNRNRTFKALAYANTATVERHHLAFAVAGAVRGAGFTGAGWSDPATRGWDG